MLAFIVGWTQLSKVPPTDLSRSNCSRSNASPLPIRGPFELIAVCRNWLIRAAFALILITDHPLLADDLSGFRVKCFALKNAKIVKSPGQLIESGQIVVRDGRVAAVGKEIEIPADAELIDVQGLTVYPGFIDAAASTFLSDEKPIPIEGHAVDVSRYALAGMRPDDHSGLTPEYRAAEHLKVTPADLDKYRQAGFVSVNVMPTGRFASGQGCVIHLASVPPRDATLSASSFAPIQIMARQRGDGPNARTEYPSTKMGAFAHLRQTFLDAERHARQTKLFAEAVPTIDRPPVDPVLESFTAIRSGRIRTTFVASERDDLDRALTLAAEHQLRITIWGGDEAYKIVDRLKKTETDMILHVDFGDEPKLEPPKPTDPAYPDIPVPKRVAEHKLAQWKERVAGPAVLRKSGVRFALSSRDGKAPSDLLKSIRAAIANGLDRDAALASLTSDAAKLLSLDADLGTIEVGRPAYFVVLTGPFDHEQSKVRYSVINGHRYEYNKDAKPVDTSKSGDQPPLQVAGTWTVEIDSAEGKVTGELELTQSDRTLSGRFQSSKGDGRITSGKVTKEGLEFVVGIGAGDSTISLKFDTVGWTFTPTTPNPPPGKEASPKPAATESNAGTPTELRGNLTSPFGAPTKWSGKRLEPKPISSAGIQLGAIEVESSSPPATPAQPASALSPANADSTAPQPIDQPVEFPEDRRARPIVTGGNVLIKNGTVLTATGATLRKTSVLVRSGTIVAIGPDLTADEGMTVIDATDRYVMPGIIDTHSHIMISNGINEMTASIVCEVRIRDVVSTTDSSEYRALAGGVTTARLLHGSANCIGGQDAVVQLKHGLSASEHLLPGAYTGVKFALGENVKSFYNRFPNTRLGVEATLNRAFMEALDYRNTWQQYERAKQQAGAAGDRILPPRRDLRLEALADIVGHQKFIHSHCYRADEILMLLRVAENHGIRVWSLQHVLEGYKVAPEIVKHGASCSTFADWWAYKVEAFDAVPHNAALLHQAGANAVIKSDDWELIRHLYLEAAKTVRYGNMPPEAAIQAITLNPANELGLSDRLGSIEVGKQADLAIFSGHPLNALSRCEQTLIAGEVYFTRAKQPSIMSEQAATRSSKPGELVLPQPEQRVTRVDLDAANDARYAIVGATIHPIDADEISAGTVLVEEGKIVAVGKDLVLPNGIRTIKGDGLHLYPGMIDAGASVGLIEIAQVRSTDDLGEVGQFQADMRAGIAVNPDSELIPVARAGGITATLCMPSSGGDMTSHSGAHGPLISGQGSVVQFAGWTMPEMVLNMEVGLQLLWPTGANRKGPIEDLKNHFREARVYDRARSTPLDRRGEVLIDPRYEAMRPYLRGEKPVFIEAETKQAIVEALQFAEQEKLKVVLCGVTDGWKVADKIKAAGAAVIVGPVMRRPIEEYDPFDAPYANAGRLHEAGIKVAFRSDTASNSRNLPFEAAMAVAYGLPEKEALRGITLSTAEILGLADRIGSLTPGKWANAVLADGSLLQQTTQIKGIFIQGKPFQPESRQTRFYEKYLARIKAVGVKPRINLFGEAGEVK